jgi:poly(3-hydroxybutyrate) depolymerase
VVFHGCTQSAAQRGSDGRLFGDGYAARAGYNRWAAAAHAVVLYPQVQPVDALGSQRHNPDGCWDFWGYTRSTLAPPDNQVTHGAPQMQAVRAMVQALGRER